MQSDLELAWGYIKYRNVDALKKLLKGDVPQQAAISDQSNDIRYLVHAAAAFGSVDCLKYLAECGADLNVDTPSGYSCVHWAAYGGWVEILEYLQTRNIPLNKADLTGQTALHVAAARGHLNVVKFLITSKLSININQTAQYKWTPLHFAVAYGHTNIARYLIENNASIKEVDTLGRSPEVLAHEYNRNWQLILNPSV